VKRTPGPEGATGPGGKDSLAEEAGHGVVGDDREHRRERPVGEAGAHGGQQKLPERAFVVAALGELSRPAGKLARRARSRGLLAFDRGTLRPAIAVERRFLGRPPDGLQDQSERQDDDRDGPDFREQQQQGRALACFLPLLLQAAEIDVATGLIKNPGWELVRANCGGCHSHALVTGQRADRQTWLDMIRWMQNTQNLWQFPPDIEAQILDYLASSYPPQPNRRRAPIPPSLMPRAEATPP